MRLEQRIEVSFHYEVHLTTNLFDPNNLLFREVVAGSLPRKVIVAIDRGVAAAFPELADSIAEYCEKHSDVMELCGKPVIVAGGECTKNTYREVARLHELIHTSRLCRHSYVVAIGGGAVLDMVGFAAATAHRGIRLIRVPTTTLSQNDSGVGVKNSINAFGKKNFLGTFAPPYAVINDSIFLEALSDRDWRAGIAEAIKVALIRDASFFDFLEENAAALVARDMPAMQKLIYRCAELHMRHIAEGGDPFEFGSARPLDYGHWAAHKLEQLTEYRLRHGEAVAVGLALDSTYAFLKGLLSERDWQRILDLIEATGFGIFVPALAEHLNNPEDSRCLLQGLEEFREHLGGELTIILLRGIGHSVQVNEIDAETVVRSVALLEERSDSFPSLCSGPARILSGERHGGSYVSAERAAAH